MSFANQDTGVVFGYQTNSRTTDGGLTWNEVAQPIGLVPNAACFADATTGYAVGQSVPFPGHSEWPDAGYCEKTTDAGATWKQLYTAVPATLWSCYAINKDVMIAGGDSRISRTNDGGLTWTWQTVIGFFDAFSFNSPWHGIGAGGDGPGSNPHGIAYITNDSGLTWTTLPMPNCAEVIGVKMFDDTTIVMCAGGAIYRTTTGGLPSGVHTQPTVNFQVQVFPSPTMGGSTIQYTLPAATAVSFTFTDARGVIVSSTAPQIQDAGTHTQPFDGTLLPNGVYYFTLSTTQGRATGSITVQR